jgi:pilus assembly protein CpaF
MGSLTSGAVPLGRGQPQAAGAELRLGDLYQQIKQAVFELALEQLDDRGVTAESTTLSVVRDEIEQAMHRYALTEGLAMNAAERLTLAEDVQHEIAGLGPLEPLLRDPTVDDVIVNGFGRVYAERAGKLSLEPLRFRDDAHVMNIIQRIIGPIGRRVDEASPYVDARLQDGSRVNIVIPPVALDGPLLSIRKFRAQPMTPQDFVAGGTMSAEMLEFLSAAVRSRLNILISGGTGSGKTTLLNMLSSFIGEAERVVTIEDAAELQIRQSHVARMETRPPNLDGAREVSARDLTRNALRMRPDRIILGEVRGAEAVEMLQAMSTGHDGSMATMHANSARDAFARLEMLLGFGGMNGDQRTLRRYMANSVNVVVHAARLANGQRRVVGISEVTGIEGDNVCLNELFTFAEHPPLSGQGAFRAESGRPFFSARLAPREEPAAPALGLAVGL